MKSIDKATDGAHEIEKLDVGKSIEEKGTAVITQKVKTIETAKEEVTEEDTAEDKKLKEVEKAVGKVKTSVDKKD